MRFHERVHRTLQRKCCNGGNEMELLFSIVFLEQFCDTANDCDS